MFTKKCKFSNRKRNRWFNCDCFNRQCHSSVTLGRKDHYLNEWETFNKHLHFCKGIKTINYCVLSCESNIKYLTTGGKILYVSLKALSQSMIIFFTLNWIFLMESELAGLDRRRGFLFLFLQISSENGRPSIKTRQVFALLCVSDMSDSALKWMLEKIHLIFKQFSLSMNRKNVKKLYSKCCLNFTFLLFCWRKSFKFQKSS